MVTPVASERMAEPVSDSVRAMPEAIRVLQIVENLDNQAVETWLLRVLKGSAADYAHVNWAFFCVLGKEGRQDNEARRLGAEVIHSRYPVGEKRRFLLGLREVIRRGRFDVLHCHHDIMSAAYLAAAAGLPLRKRIVHLHNTSLSLPTPDRFKAELARAPMRQVCLRMADQIVGISKDALESLVGKSPASERHRVIHYAVDTSAFSRPAGDRAQFQRELGLAAATKVLLFVGRLVDYKNPLFLVEVLQLLAGAGVDAALVLAGSGIQEDALREAAQQKSLSDRVRLLGFRDDVPELMRNADVLLWPSLEDPKEGLGLGIIEAQAAGLPIVMSKSVPDEAIVVPELVDVLPLARGAGGWATAVAEILKRPRPDQRQALAKVEASSFSMAAGVRNIMALYEV
jgi:glycosyltransferase involved in cell wall biosynthesis